MLGRICVYVDAEILLMQIHWRWLQLLRNQSPLYGYSLANNCQAAPGMSPYTASHQRLKSSRTDRSVRHVTLQAVWPSVATQVPVPCYAVNGPQCKMWRAEHSGLGIGGAEQGSSPGAGLVPCILLQERDPTVNCF